MPAYHKGKVPQDWADNNWESEKLSLYQYIPTAAERAEWAEQQPDNIAAKREAEGGLYANFACQKCRRKKQNNNFWLRGDRDDLYAWCIECCRNNKREPEKNELILNKNRGIKAIDIQYSRYCFSQGQEGAAPYEFV